MTEWLLRTQRTLSHNRCSHHSSKK